MSKNLNPDEIAVASSLVNQPEPDMRYSVDVSSGIPLIHRTNTILKTLRDSPTAFVYKRDGYPVRITGVGEKKPRIEVLTVDKLRYEVSRNLICLVAEEEVEPPLSIIRNAIATGDFPLENLNGIIRHPTITRKGEVVFMTGYDYDTGLFLVPHEYALGPAKSLTREPTDEDIQRAVLILNDMLDDFPFVDQADKTNALAAFLTVLCRPLIQGLVPAFLVQAPTAGTGKTLLVTTLLGAILGEKPKPIKLTSSDDDEIEKRLASILMNGDEYIFFDNIPEKLKSNTLCLAITSGYFQARLLGKNEMIELPVKCPMFFTGNNPKPNDEMARRSINIRLDANTERPWEKKGFKIKDKVKYTLENHPYFVAAGLTLARAWVTRGRVPSEKTLGSFEQWAQTIGGILETAGIPGFMGNAEAFYQSADTDTAQWTAFTQKWHAKYGDAPVLAKDLVDIAVETEIIEDISRKKSLGKVLGSNEGKIFGGLKMTKGYKSCGFYPWKVKPITSNTPV